MDTGPPQLDVRALSRRYLTEEVLCSCSVPVRQSERKKGEVVSGASADKLLPVAEAVHADVPWLWWARTGDVRLAGMPAPPPGFPLSFLHEQGFDTIVSLAGPGEYDPGSAVR